MEDKDIEIVVLKFNKPIIPEGNIFGCLTNLNEDNNNEAKRIREINDAVKESHEKILKEALTNLYKKMEDACIGGVETKMLDIKCETPSMKCRPSYGTIRLIKNGNNQYVDNVDIGIESIENVNCINSETYQFSFRSKHTYVVFKRDTWKEIEYLMLEAIEAVIEKDVS